MKKTLVSWVGGHDFDAVADQTDGWGPVCNAVRDRDFDRIVLLSNYPKSKSKSDGFVAWLQE
ncbi:MAG: AAA family ATPase, partial [Fuerstiella sp.]